MSLTEPQILRYSRQILLREVGGRGQQSLLAATVRVVGEGPALATAAAFLEAGGTACLRDGASSAPGPGSSSDVLLSYGSSALPDRGAIVLVTPSSVIAASAETCRACIAENAASGRESAPPNGEPIQPTGPMGRVPTTSRPSTHDTLGPPPRTDNAPTSELLGALAALAHQRLILGLDRGLRVARIDADGTLTTPSPARCEAHR